MGSLNITDRQSKLAKDSLRTGKYHLLLGAGASAGAKTPRGPVPLSSGLVDFLRKAAPSAPMEDGISLNRAYQRAATEIGQDKVWWELRKCFSPVTHQPWFTTMIGLPWAKIWTLNVDDAVERSYDPEESATGREMDTLSWDDPYSETGNLEVIHLHGHILGKHPSPLIFSYSEYIAASSERPVWHQMIGGLLSVEPFVILGARLLDDPDLEALILRNHYNGHAPSFVVDPYIDPGNQWELERNGFTVVKESAEEFLKHIEDEFALNRQAIASIRESKKLSLPQFESLETNRSLPRSRGHDFFAGDAPVWKDILDGYPADLKAASALEKSVLEWLNSDERAPRLLISYGSRFSGVTTNLLTVARRIIPLGVRVLSFNKLSRWTPEILVDVAQEQPTVVLIDGSYDFADDIDRTMQVAQDRSTPLLVLAAETYGNELRLEERLSNGYSIRIVKDHGRLTRRDAGNLYQRVWDQSRAGKLEHVTRQKAIDLLVDRDVFSAMLEFEYGSGFRHRISTEIENLSTDWQANLVLLLGLASTEHRVVSLTESAMAVGVSPDKIVTELGSDSALQSLVQVNNGLIVARQREKLLPVFVERFGQQESLERVRSIIVRLAPAVTRSGLRERNRLPMLVTHLMTYKTLQRAFPQADFGDFYQALQPQFGAWSGRFWEQRAIREKSVRNWGKAESFAGRAVTLYDDPYTRTTYGTILLNRATALAGDDDDAWRSFYDRAQEQFEVAHRLDMTNRITLFANLDGSIELLRALPDDSLAKAELLTSWNQSYATLAVDMLNTPGLESQERLERLSAKYEALVGR